MSNGFQLYLGTFYLAVQWPYHSACKVVGIPPEAERKSCFIYTAFTKEFKT